MLDPIPKDIHGDPSISGRKKAAILVACLGPAKAGQVMNTFKDEEVDQMTLDLSALGTVDANLKADIFD